MKAFSHIVLLSFGIVASVVAQDDTNNNNNTAPTTPNVEAVEYNDNGFPLLGYVSIPEAAQDTPVPGVVIIPDWTNVDEYEQIRATMLNEQFGYVGFAADLYGPELQGVENRTIRGEQASLYRGNSTLFTSRIQAAVDVLKNHPAVLPDKIAIIGYCLGGTGVLTYSFVGSSDIVGAVSFHGGLIEFPVEDPILHPVLVLSGGDDDTGTEVEDLEGRLDSANATWQITRYSGIEHAFTVWDDPRYNELADDRSWHEMSTFLAEAFGEITYGTNAPDTTTVDPVDYDDDGFALTGYLAIPDGAEMGNTAAVVIVPDWDGVSGPDGYEAGRATLLAEEGYVAFAADIYGSDLQQIESFDERAEQATLYRTNYTLFVSRIQAAVDLVAQHELVDREKIVMIGYCFGGTGVVDYAFTDLKDVKAVVPFHGGLTSVAPIQTDVIYPYVLIESGGEDDAHGNNTELEISLNGANATWEITRYSDVFHGFTDWDGQAYNALADWRSWDAMLTVFDMILSDDSNVDLDMDVDADSPAEDVSDTNTESAGEDEEGVSNNGEEADNSSSESKEVREGENEGQGESESDSANAVSAAGQFASTFIAAASILLLLTLS